MPGLQVHWFLPTAGDSRDVSGGGISKTVASADSTVRAPDIDYLAQVAKAAEQLGLHGRADADRHLVRGRMADHGRAHQGDHPAQVPRRVPARRTLADAGRTDGRDLPADLRRPAAAQRRHRWRPDRGSSASATGPRTTSATPVPTSSCPSSAAPGAGCRTTSPGTFFTTAGALVAVPPDPVPPVFFGGASPAALDVAARHADVYLDLGRAARRRRRAGRSRPPARRGAGPRGALRHPDARHHAGHRGRGLGAGRPAARADGSRRDRGRPAVVRARRLGGAAAHVGAARRRDRQPRDLPERMGRRRPDPRRGGHRARGLARAGRRADRGVPRARHSTTSSCPGSRTWKRPTSSERAYSPCCAGFPPRRPSSASAFAGARTRPLRWRSVRARGQTGRGSRRPS